MISDDWEMVPLAGLEPALRKELDFESSASTNFTTGAREEQRLDDPFQGRKILAQLNPQTRR